MSFWNTKIHTINRLNVESNSFKVSVFDWLFDRLVVGLEVSTSAESKMDHVENYIKSRNRISSLCQRYNDRTKEMTEGQKVIIAKIWHEYWNLWFETTLNTYSPNKLIELAQNREVLEKKLLSEMV